MHRSIHVLAFLCACLLAAPAAAQFHRYRQVKITDDPNTFEYFPQINNRGQVVFTGRNPGDGHDRNDEVFLYDQGRLIQITDDSKKDAYPDLNDDGTIVWSRAIGPEGEFGPTFEIMMRSPDGRVQRLTDDDLDDWSPHINNLGHVAWDATFGIGCMGNVHNHDVQFYDGNTITRLTYDADEGEGKSNQVTGINDLDELVWTRYDFCVIGQWTSEIVLYRDGRKRVISDDPDEAPQVPKINNDGLVVWTYLADPDGVLGIRAWQDGVTTEVSDWGSTPDVNNRGQIVFHRWYDAEENYEIWSYQRGRLQQLTFDAGYNYVPRINDRGEIAFQCGEPFWGDACLLTHADLLDDPVLVPLP